GGGGAEPGRDAGARLRRRAGAPARRRGALAERPPAEAPRRRRGARRRRALPVCHVKYDFDLFTIGGGSGGVRASRVSAGYGAKVAIAEFGRFGGTCGNGGCIPKKLFSYAAHMREDLAVPKSFGW